MIPDKTEGVCGRGLCWQGRVHGVRLVSVRVRVRVVISTELRSSEGDEELVKRGI